MMAHHICNLNVDLFTMSETWLNSKLPSSLFKVKGYKLDRLDRSWSVNGRGIKKGVAAFIKENVNYSMTEYSRFNLSTSSVELLWISINNPNQSKIIVGIVYRPPMGDFREFVTKIKEMANDINVNNLEVFLIGDCNVDYSKHGTCNKKLIKEFETLTGLHQIIKQPTRYGNNNSLIDLVFSNSSCINEHGTLDLNVSDHEAIFIIRKKSKEKFTIIDGYGRSYLNYEKNSFQANVRAADWSKLSEIRDINEYWNIIEETIKKGADTEKSVTKLDSWHQRQHRLQFVVCSQQ